MARKIIIPIILALVVSLAFSSVGYAANDRLKFIYHEKGSVMSVDVANLYFRMSTQLGARRIYVGTNTVFQGIASNLSQLTPWMVVNVRAKLLPDGKFLALGINTIRIEPIYTIEGQVTAVHFGTFTVLGSDQISYTFVVKAKTTFSGHGVTNFRELRSLMLVSVKYIKTGKGNLQAQEVLVLSKK